MVSHGFGYIRALCNRVMWLKLGRVEQMGTPDEVIRAYESSVFSRAGALSPTAKPDDDGQVQIVSVTLLDEQGCPKQAFRPLDPVTVRIGYLKSSSTESLAFAVGVMRDDTLNCYTTYSDESGFAVPTAHPGGLIEAQYERLHLMPGSYQMYVTALSSDDKRTIYTYRTVAFHVTDDDGLDIRHGSFYNLPSWRLGETVAGELA
jgi:ABC-type glutathione transport system ATPase component